MSPARSLASPASWYSGLLRWYPWLASAHPPRWRAHATSRRWRQMGICLRSWPAIALATTLASLLAFFLSYGSLVDVSNVALFCQYIPTCLAVIVLRYRRPDAERTFRLPLGPVIPLAGAGISVVLLAMARPRPQQWIFAAELLGLGVVIWTVTGLVRRAAERRAGSARSAPGLGS